MRSRQNVLVGLLVISALVAMVGSAVAAPLVVDANVLSGKAVATSSVYGDGTGFGAVANVTNGLGGGPTADFIFQPGDGQQRMVIHGFDSAVNLIRIWSGNDRPPARVCIKSSTTDLSPTAADFANGQAVGESFGLLLHDMADISYPSAWTQSGSGVDNMDLYYTDIAVNAPAGTKSLYLDIGYGSGGGGDWTRISEVQAFAVPEPGTLTLLAGAILGLAAYAWRKRR